MKKLFRYHSIQKRFFIYFTGFVLLILILIWGLLIALLEPNYVNSKKADLVDLASDINSVYTVPAFRAKADRLSFENNTEILVYDLKNQIYTYSTVSLVTSRYVESFPQIIEQVSNNDGVPIMYTVEFKDIETEMLIYSCLIDNDNAILILLTSIDPIDSTTLILAKQLMLISIAVLVLATILSFIIARKLSKPIGSIAKAAKNIADEGYDASQTNTGGFAELKDLSQALEDASIEIAQVQNLRRELIANTSHDLRTPLTMIKAYAEMIRDLSGDNTEKRKEHLNVIINETDRLSRLVGDMLELSKLESGKRELELSEISLKDCINETIEKFNLLRETQGYVFDLQVDDDFIVRADRFRLTQVLYNLISNAVVHSGNDKTVEVKLLEDTQGTCRVEIADHGEGIPKDELPHIWERYYRTKKSHKRAQIGTGLGLSIVKNILIAHGSEFGVKSTVGKGTTFYFKMKIIPNESDPNEK